MRNFAPVTAAVAAALFLAAGLVSAESLAEIAARTQREKEAKGRPKAKVITEADLRSGGATGGSVSQPGSTTATPAPAASPAPGAAASGATPATGPDGKPVEKPKTPDEERAEQVAAWRTRMEKAQADVTRLSTEVGELESSLANVSAAQYSPARAKMSARLDAARAELAAARQDVDNITEEGRRAGIR